MKRLLILLFLISFAFIIACGGGGDGSYNFSGNWMFEERVTADPYGLATSVGFPVGSVGRWMARIDQNGETIVIRDIDTGDVLQGTCDPGRKTFVVQAFYPGGVLIRYQGKGESGDLMSGTARAELAGFWFEVAWTASLIGR